MDQTQEWKTADQYLHERLLFFLPKKDVLQSRREK